MKVYTLPVGPLQTNCYLVVCPETQAGVIIDPGGDADDIAAAVEQHRVSLAYILLTHAHFDHMGAVAQLVEASGAPLAAHPAESALLKLGGGGALFGFVVRPAPPPDVRLAEGQVLEVGTLRLHVLHTPGHTPGHVAFHEPAHRAVFDGDVLFAGGIGRTDLPGGNTKQLMDSIQTKLLALPDETIVYSGHGPATTIGRERRYNPFL
ncbi:MAG: MBL fold metallo-hydrolase [Thermoflexales bacterium]|nr:MBL fold metallo-hydrolase [Thermoflexales bacterium]